MRKSELSMVDEKLCLTWNDFQENVKVAFGELRVDNDFTDVTLACEDQSVKAHKVILSACSPFFKKLLKTHPHPQPLVYMRGIKSSELVAVVDFIYRGEANIFQEQLESFLALAEELQLKGLTGNLEEKPEEVSVPLLDRNQINLANDTMMRRGKAMFRDLSQTREVAMVKNEIVPTIQTKLRQSKEIEFETLQKVESMIVKRDNVMFCTNCDYTSKHGGHMREHVEKHIEGLEYPCNSCGKVMRSSHAFREHKRKCS